MNTNQSNVSFQSVRVFCSKAKTRLLRLAFLLCLSGSAWAQSLPFDLTMPDVLMLFKGSWWQYKPGRATQAASPVRAVTGAPRGRRARRPTSGPGPPPPFAPRPRRGG